MWGWLICITVNTGMTGGRYHLIVFFSCAFLFFSLAFSVPLYRWLEDGGCWVCFFVFFALFLSLVSLTNAYKLLHKYKFLWQSVFCKTFLKVRYLIIILWISLQKVEYFDFNESLGCVYPTLHIIRLLGQVYYFRWFVITDLLSLLMMLPPQLS